MPFVNTLKQDAKKREETERLAVLKDQKQQLQNEHNKQLEERSQAEHQRQKAQQQMMRKHHEAFEEAKNFIVALHGPNNLPQALDIPACAICRASSARTATIELCRSYELKQ